MTEAAPAAPGPGASELLPDTMTREAAGTRIAELKADKGFLEKYLGGEVAARDEFVRLHATAFGNNSAANEAGQRRGMFIDTLKSQGELPQACWDQVRNNGPVFQHERDFALQTKEQLFRDKAWVARYLDGSREERSLLLRISLILASPVKKEGS